LTTRRHFFKESGLGIGAIALSALLNEKLLAGLGTIILSGFLVIHIMKDLSSPAEAWYFHSTPVWG